VLFFVYILHSHSRTVAWATGYKELKTPALIVLD